MTSKSDLRELFAIHDQASLKKIIERLETQIGEVVSDAQYRSVWMPCPPMEDEKKRFSATEKEEVDNPTEEEMVGAE